jgi:hypothetical protein
MAKSKRHPLLTFDNHVSFGHIFTTLCILVSGVWYVANNDNRVTSLERQDTVIMERLNEVRTEISEDIREIKSVLKDISDKLNDKVDRSK